MGVTKGQNQFSALKTPFLSLLWSKTYRIKKNPPSRIIQKLYPHCVMRLTRDGDAVTLGMAPAHELTGVAPFGWSTAPLPLSF